MPRIIKISGKYFTAREGCAKAWLVCRGMCGDERNRNEHPSTLLSSMIENKWA